MNVAHSNISSSRFKNADGQLIAYSSWCGVRWFSVPGMTYLRVPSSKSIILWEIPALGAVPDEFKAYEEYAPIRQSSA